MREPRTAKAGLVASCSLNIRRQAPRNATACPGRRSSAAALAVILALSLSVAWADPPAATTRPASQPTKAPQRTSLWKRRTLTDDWFGLGRRLRGKDRRARVGLALTEIYQHNVHGGISTHRRNGRHAGSYDLEVEGRFWEKTVAENVWKAGPRTEYVSLFLSAEGDWSDGIDASSIDSVFGVNADAGGDAAFLLSEAFIDLGVEDMVVWRFGRLDITRGIPLHGSRVAFDANALAGDEKTQFLNGALVNNPTIPIPERAWGIILAVGALRPFYLAGGALYVRRTSIHNTGLGHSDINQFSYYNHNELTLTPWLSITPSVQYILNPGGNAARKDAVIVGVRVRIAF